MFANRIKAGQLLAKKLLAFKKKKDVLVLGIPRGGVVVAKAVALALSVPLDVLIIKKIGAQDNEELAIGAVSMDDYYLNDDLAFDTPKAYVQEQVKRKQQEAKERYEFLCGKRRQRSLKGKVVIVVDDGVATGATMSLAVKILKQQQVKKIVIATPVAPPEAVRALLHEAEVICLEQPESFLAIGQYYRDFTQVEVGEVKALLQ